MVGLVGLEPTTPALSRRCSNQLSYRPFTQPKGGGDRDPAAAKAQEGAMLDQLTRMLRSTTADKSGRSDSSANVGLASFWLRPALTRLTLLAQSQPTPKRLRRFPERR